MLTFLLVFQVGASIVVFLNKAVLLEEAMHIEMEGIK
jgi:hypothetical protein